MRSSGIAALLLVLTAGVPVRGQEGVFLTEDEAPGAVFADADRFVRREVATSEELRGRMRQHLDGTTPSVWEEQYVVFEAYRADRLLGRALLVEEIGKHRPISFVVGVRADGAIEDVAVMAYREPYGGEVRQARFLAQYRGKQPSSPLRTYRDIVNVAGATLSVDAANRAVRKAQALSAALAGDGR